MIKEYECEIEGCNNTTIIRSTIKTGVNKGKKACPKCKQTIDKVYLKSSYRKTPRPGLVDFFLRHIFRVKTCENCGITIMNPGAKNVAHIIPKSTFPSVMTNDDNALYLCTNFDRFDNKTGCHETYDQTWSKAKGMVVWATAKERFKKFKDFIEEKSNILSHFE